MLISASSADLKTLRTKRQTELSGETSRKNTLSAAAQQAAQQLTTSTAAHAARKLESANVAFEYAAKKADLLASKKSLPEAQAQSASLEETMTRLANDAIVYDVKSDETVFQNLRPFVSRFAAVFASGAVFSTSLSFDALDLTIPSTGQFGTVDFPMDFMIASTVQDIAVAYDMTHGNPVELTISLINPAGSSIVLRNQNGGPLKEIVSKDGRLIADQTSRVASLQSFEDTQAKGTWKLRITDNFGGSVGKLQSVRLMLKVKSN